MTSKTGTRQPSLKEQPVQWECLTCEYVVVSATLPYRCPRCGASRVKFVELGTAGEADE